MDRPRKNSSEKIKPKKKLTKAQIQLAIIRKGDCDAQAQAIVEKLLEPNVDSQWMLENLRHINKCHMEDVIEERSIEKLCGYALCKKPLTAVITQRYHISTKSNKVYDVSRRKSFCSSYCYGAMNYLLEQMFTSPLWLREEEQIPEFRLLTDAQKAEINIPGEEVIVFKEDSIKKDETEANKSELTKTVLKDKETLNISLKQENQKKERNQNNEKIEQSSEDTESKSAPNTEDTIIEIEDQKPKKKSVTFQIPDDYKESSSTSYQRPEEAEREINPLTTNDSLVKDVIDREKSDSSIKTTMQISRKKSKFQRERKKFSKDSKKVSETLVSLVKRIEENCKEWITEDTLRFLLGEETTKQQVFDNVTKQEKYVALCQKLNKLQLEDEREERANEEKIACKAVPEYSFLQEEGKKLQLKVRAFYEGRTVIQVPDEEDKNDQSGNDEDSNTVFPLTEARAPKAIRRKIFLDMLNNILPDLLRALSGSGQILPAHFAYNQERVTAIKALVSTFTLTANNIVFKMTEWTLVGLIIIKMLSGMDSGLKYLLSTKQASLYTSMILMSYQLDSNYLDTFIISLTNKMPWSVNESTL